MNRTEKKCFYTSAATHFTLLTLLFLSPALVLTKRSDLSRPVLTFLPSITTDMMAVGGGNPSVQQPPAKAAAPLPEPTPPAPIQPNQESEAKPESPVPPNALKSEPVPSPVKPAPKTAFAPPKPEKSTPDISPTKIAVEKPSRKIEPSFTESKGASKPSKTNNSSFKAAEAKARSDAAAKARAWQQAYASQVQRLGNQLTEGLSNGTSIEIPGPGGAAYANYGLVIEAIYSQAWIPPSDLNDDGAKVIARVVIRKDGQVIAAQITLPSKHRNLNKTVERALERKPMPPFPNGAKDNERTFIIEFDLKTKRLSG
ncbi:MAG: hypothetical protein EXS30_10895 [Pedosphaera sp.]|nr:hypothetical protein [Pedosphaera sp.]